MAALKEQGAGVDSVKQYLPKIRLAARASSGQER